MSRLSIGILIFCAADSVTLAAQAKNVVLFVVDDQGFQAGCYGNEVIKVPNIDRLAASGTRFTHGFCTTASCSASRSVLMTGQYNHATGHYGHEHAYHHFSTFENVLSLPVILARAGYRTCSIGKYHLAPEPVYHFETYRNEGIQGNRNSVRMARNARQWIEESDDRPFFLYFCTSDPHRGGGPDGFANFNDDPNRYPGVIPVRYDPDRVVVPPFLPNQPEVRQELAEYYQAISRLDQGLGVLLDALVETGHQDDTLFIFLSDNGPPFPGAKTTLYGPGMNLPLIVRDPGQTKKGIVTDAMVNWADITPTILDYTGVDPMKIEPKNQKKAEGGKRKGEDEIKKIQMHGRSFLSVLGQERSEGFDEINASHTFHEITMYYPMRVIQNRQYKYILNLAHQLPYPFASDLYASPTWQGVLKRGSVMLGNRPVEDYIHRPRHELYDIQSDPHELYNLAEDPKLAGVLARMQSKLKKWQEQTNDPWILKWIYE